MVEGIRSAVAKGALASGDRLPSVRELAAGLMINHNTIAHAYQELEREGVIEVLRGRGTFIAQTPVVINADARKKEMRATIRRLIIEAHHLQMSDDALRTIFEQELQRWRAERE
ncbi:MAG: GntR family transcriptional regulator [Gammaproteobacteria bacterium]|nr:GntR family transcriptional regulator [Gammaproteobacteria bacterium]